MYITPTDMDNNKDRIKLITVKDQDAINTIWNLAQNTTTKLNEKKKIWIPALGRAMEREFNITTHGLQKLKLKEKKFSFSEFWIFLFYILMW
jgi:hypothetical protein